MKRWFETVLWRCFAEDFQRSFCWDSTVGTASTEYHLINDPPRDDFRKSFRSRQVYAD
jgi:hypothetical protein